MGIPVVMFGGSAVSGHARGRRNRSRPLNRRRDVRPGRRIDLSAIEALQPLKKLGLDQCGAKLPDRRARESSSDRN